MEKMFEYATRTKMRFEVKGMISVEDLWDLSMKDLKAYFITLKRQLKEKTDEMELLEDDIFGDTSVDKNLETKLEIVKYIYMTKEEERQKKLDAERIKQEKQFLLELKREKLIEQQKNMSLEEIDAKLNELK